MCEKCEKQKKVKDKCTTCRKNRNHKIEGVKMKVKLKVKKIKGRVPMYTLAAKKPGINIIGKNIR